MKSIIKRVLEGDWASLQSDIEKMAADKVKSRVDDKKYEVLARINDTDVNKQRERMTAK